jgi:hypothetical protein
LILKPAELGKGFTKKFLCSKSALLSGLFKDSNAESNNPEKSAEPQ